MFKFSIIENIIFRIRECLFRIKEFSVCRLILEFRPLSKPFSGICNWKISLFLEFAFEEIVGLFFVTQAFYTAWLSLAGSMIFNFTLIIQSNLIDAYAKYWSSALHAFSVLFYSISIAKTIIFVFAIKAGLFIFLLDTYQFFGLESFQQYYLLL